MVYIEYIKTDLQKEILLRPKNEKGGQRIRMAVYEYLSRNSLIDINAIGFDVMVEELEFSIIPKNLSPAP